MKTLRSTLESATEFVLDGTHGSPVRVDNGVPVLSAQNVGIGNLNWTTSRFTTETEYAAFARRLCPRQGDLLLTIVGTIGRATVLGETPPPLVFQRSVCVIRPKVDCLDSKYLYYTTRSADFQKQIKKSTNQSSQAGVYLKKLKAIEIPLPPLPEQKRIAGILDAADALRAKRRESLAQLDILVESTFLEMFGDPVTNPKGWEVQKLKDVFTFETGKLNSNASIPGGKFPFFTCCKETLTIDCFAFDCEALLLAGNNASGDYSVKHYRGKFNAYQRTYVIAVNQKALMYEYSRVALELMLSDLKEASKGTNTKYLTLGILNRMTILVPPLALQRRFAAIVESVEMQRARMRTHLAEVEALFASLQARAFAGEL